MGKISYSDHVKKSDISVVIAEIIFQSLKKTHKFLPLSKVVDTSSGGTPSRTNQSYYGGEIPWLKSGEMNDSLITQAEEFITEEGLNNSSAKRFPKGTLLVAMYGATAGKTGILDIDASTNQAVCAVTPKDKSTNKDFLFWFFRANRFYFIDISRGGAQPNISQSVIENTDFPIVEDKLQKNIALFLSNLEQTKEAAYSLIPPDLCKPVKLAFDYLSCLQKLECENKNQEKYVFQLKQAVLQEAIAGHLTAEWRTQNPMQKGNPNTDAIALLAKIKAEKQQAIADGKLKKEKPLAEVAINETPFFIPDNWVLCRLGQISSIVRGGSPRPAGDKKYYEGSIPFLKVADLTRVNTIFLNDYTYTIKEAGLNNTRFVEANTLMLTNSGATLGVPRICTFPTTFNDGIAAFLGLSDEFNKVFLYYFLKAKTKWFLAEAARGQGQPNLNTDIIGNTLLVLPPLAEQKAIVEKVDKLMNIIDQLEQQIKHRKQLAEALMQTVLREAFE